MGNKKKKINKQTEFETKEKGKKMNKTVDTKNK